MWSVHIIFVKYITVSLVSVLGSSVGSVSSYSSGPKIDPRVQNMVGATADSRRACFQLLAVKIRVKCLRRLAKEECGSETDRPDIRGGPICNDIALITPPTHLLDLYTIYGMKYQGFIFWMVHKTLFYRPYLSCYRRLKKVHLYTLYIFASELKRTILTKKGGYALLSKRND